jgi:TonB-dependent starch-binding outer membrane protein SusC
MRPCFRILILAVLVTSPATAQATSPNQALAVGEQSAHQPVLDRPARLHVDAIDLYLALTRLQESSGSSLAFSPTLLEGKRIVRCSCKDLRVAEALDIMLAGTGFGYVEINRQILIEPVTDPKTPGEAAVEVVRAIAQIGTIVGRVVEEGTRRPLGGVQVSVVGSGQGALTDQAGRFRLANVPSGEVTVRAHYIGYRTGEWSLTVTPNEVATVEFQLTQQAIALDGIVVTGTAGRTERRAQGAAIANVELSRLVDLTPVRNVTEVLQGRVPGVSVSQGSGVAGTGQQIRIRGASSISLSNEPLVYVDGVRIDTKLTSVASGATVSALNFLNPAEIESIEIVKGPAAATLYGADATAGVIQIITKRGVPGTNFRHTISLSGSQVDPNFTSAPNFGVCRDVDVNRSTSLCSGLAVGSIVSDRPLERSGLPNNGSQQTVSWTARGGGEGWGFFSSFGLDREEGIFPNSKFQRASARVNYHVMPTENTRIDFNLPFTLADGAFPTTGGSSRGFTVGAWAGSPLTVGSAADGWQASNRTRDALSAVENDLHQVRLIPDLKFRWDPGNRFTNRITVGGDVGVTEVANFFPKNDRGWYSAQQNRGDIAEERTRLVRLTASYLGTVNLPISQSWGSVLSLGSEIQAEEEDFTFSTGNGLTTNAARAVSAAAQVSGGHAVVHDRRVGFFGQWEPNFKERVYLQFGARADRFAAFGSDAPWFLSPSLRLSYVLSDEPFWNVGWVNAFRLRTAYGTTGRSPPPGAALRTFAAAPYLTGATGVASGVVPMNVGNPDLAPERGEEFEFGFDAALLNDRLGLEFTFFNQITRDLLLRVPQAPSLGFTEDPFRNIGKVLNRGIEVGATAQLLAGQSLAWEIHTGFNTLRNEVLDLGGVAPFSTIRFGQVNMVTEGQQVGAYHTHRIRRVDTSAGVAIVSDTIEAIGNLQPAFEGNVSSTATFRGSLRFYANVNFKQNFRQYNATQVYRERNDQIDERWVRRDEILTVDERLRRFGPYVTESGQPIGAASVLEEYIEPADLVRINEMSVSYQIPNSLLSRLPGETASVTFFGRNLALWSQYSGFNPDVQNEFAAIAGRADFYSLPPPRVFGVRVDLTY